MQKDQQMASPHTLSMKSFLSALSSEFPKDTYGIALGFDRILMLLMEKKHIKDVIL